MAFLLKALDSDLDFKVCLGLAFALICLAFSYSKIWLM